MQKSRYITIRFSDAIPTPTHFELKSFLGECLIEKKNLIFSYLEGGYGGPTPGNFENQYKAPDKDWRQLGIYPPLFGLFGYLKF